MNVKGPKMIIHITQIANYIGINSILVSIFNLSNQFYIDQQSHPKTNDLFTASLFRMY